MTILKQSLKKGYKILQVKSIFNYLQRAPLKFLEGLESILYSGPVSGPKDKRLLIVKLDSIGDYVLFRNFIEVVKKSKDYRGYKITLCGNSWWKDLSEELDNRLIDEFIWVNYNQMSVRSYRWSVFRLIRREKFRTVLHPTFSRDSISDDVVLNSGAPERIGYSGDEINLTPGQKIVNDQKYTRLIPSKGKYRFEFDRNKDFFEQHLNCKVEMAGPEIKISNSELHKIIICPGAKVEWRRWHPKKFAELCERLQLDFPKAQFVICGSASENHIAEQVISSVKLHFENKCGQLTLPELLTEFSSAMLIITNDSGPFHMAVAMGKRTVCISNGNNYGRFTPYPAKMQTKSRVVFPPELLFDTEEKRLEKYGREGSKLDINSIEIEHVKRAIEELMDS